MALKSLIVRGEEAKRMRDVFAAMLKLKRAEWGVAVGDGPGLTYVDGRQLTTDQLLDFASRIK